MDSKGRAAHRGHDQEATTSLHVASSKNPSHSKPSEERRAKPMATPRERRSPRWRRPMHCSTMLPCPPPKSSALRFSGVSSLSSRRERCCLTPRSSGDPTRRGALGRQPGRKLIVGCRPRAPHLVGRLSSNVRRHHSATSPVAGLLARAVHIDHRPGSTAMSMFDNLC